MMPVSVTFSRPNASEFLARHRTSWTSHLLRAEFVTGNRQIHTSNTDLTLSCEEMLQEGSKLELREEIFTKGLCLLHKNVRWLSFLTLTELTFKFGVSVTQVEQEQDNWQA